MKDINENQQHSRPSRYTWLIGVAAILGIFVSIYWAEISEFANFLQIRNALGL
jgi:hypothetical protein